MKKFKRAFLFIAKVIISVQRKLKFRKVQNYQDLLLVAMWEIKILSRCGPVSMVSAPLFSGGSGDFNQNLLDLRHYIVLVEQSGTLVWSQIPYLDVQVKRWSKCEFDATKKILEFYVPLIRGKLISKLICSGGVLPEIARYSDSWGCKTEREAAIEAGIELESLLKYFKN